ncbi:MAG: type II secretion system F family protein [Clostridia bacterium]|nr:type II secretion system F family protein [Clostridia bacterium]
MIMTIIFLVVAGIFGLLYALSKNKYNEYIEPLDEKTYRLKKILPLGLYVLDAIKYKYSNTYDRSLLSKISEISGHKYAQYYLQIHMANKIAFILLVMFLLSVIGMGMGPDVGFGVFSFLVLIGVFYFTDSELNEKIKKRRLEIQLDFPDFLNKLTLLINAGMTVGRAWEKIVTDNKKTRPLYEEVGLVISEIKSGKPDFQAYEDFAKRCRTPEITKFVSVILQNLKKGSAELVSILRLQASECWEMRKHAAKRLGEEASTKMLLPMMIMFVAILIIVAVPAMLSMQGI